MLPVAWPADFHLGASRPGKHRKVYAHDLADRLAWPLRYGGTGDDVGSLGRFGFQLVLPGSPYLCHLDW